MSLELVTTGRGKPVTIFVHGATGSIATTRPFGGGVIGSRVFVHLPGYGKSPPLATPTYVAISRLVRDSAAAVAATQAFGISLGAAVVARLLVDEPGLLSKAVLALPALPSVARLTTLADALDSGQSATLLAEETGAAPSIELRRWASSHASTLEGWAVADTLRGLAADAPLPDSDRLAYVDVPVLVLAQQDDPAHPVSASRDLADKLPNATLEILPPGGLLWAHRSRVRELVSSFLAPEGDLA